MILLIDAGNSRIKWACLVGGVIQSGEPVSRSRDTSTDVQTLAQAWAPLPRPDRIAAVSVIGPEFAAALSSWAAANWQRPIDMVSAQHQARGVINGYREPERLGADRWVALIAARRIARGAVCIIDCGTAVTLDAMRRDGRHLGGVIIPGLGLMERLLAEGTEGIGVPGDRSVAADPSPFATNTGEAVRSGALYAVVSTIERITRETRKVLGRNLHCMVTGGDAERVLPRLSGRFDHQPELVLKGLAVIVEEAG
jgi:type III pantothenate kinase